MIILSTHLRNITSVYIYKALLISDKIIKIKKTHHLNMFYDKKQRVNFWPSLSTSNFIDRIKKVGDNVVTSMSTCITPKFQCQHCQHYYVIRECKVQQMKEH